MRLLAALVVSSATHIGLALLPFAEGGASSAPDRTLRPLLRASLISLPILEERGSSSVGTSIADDAALSPRVLAGSREAADPSPSTPPGDYGAQLFHGKLYYLADVLTRRPQALSVGDLETPETAAMGASAQIALRIWIDETGQVVNLAVENGGLPNVFADAASRAFLKAKFTPGELDGKTVGSVIRVEVSFESERLMQPPKRLFSSSPPTGQD